MTLTEQLLAILVPSPDGYESPDTIAITHTPAMRDRPEEFRITLGKEYEAPPINFAMLRQLSELFGTDDIDVDDYAQSGCETCDWGSDYGHYIQLRGVTKSRAELFLLVGQDLAKPTS